MRFRSFTRTVVVAVARVNTTAGSIKTSDELWIVVEPHANEAGQAAVVVMLEASPAVVPMIVVVPVDVKHTGRFAATEGTHVAEA